VTKFHFSLDGVKQCNPLWCGGLLYPCSHTSSLHRHFHFDRVISIIGNVSHTHLLTFYVSYFACNNCCYNFYFLRDFFGVCCQSLDTWTPLACRRILAIGMRWPLDSSHIRLWINSKIVDLCSSFSSESQMEVVVPDSNLNFGYKAHAHRNTNGSASEFSQLNGYSIAKVILICFCSFIVLATLQAYCGICETRKRLLCINCMTCLGCKTRFPGRGQH
jgi:hypothetical protein